MQLAYFRLLEGILCSVRVICLVGLIVENSRDTSYKAGLKIGTFLYFRTLCSRVVKHIVSLMFLFAEHMLSKRRGTNEIKGNKGLVL